MVNIIPYICKHIKKGNHKIGKDTLIFNMGPAKTCPSKALGLCQLQDTNKCYAHRAEVQYSKTVLYYRIRQMNLWLAWSANL